MSQYVDLPFGNGVTSLNGLMGALTLAAGSGIGISSSGSTITITNTAGGAGSFTQGSVIFAGATGALAQDNAQFFWDDTNHRLGLGTATPAGILDVQGQANSKNLINLIGGSFNNVGTAGTVTITGGANTIGASNASAIAGSVLITGGGALAHGTGGDVVIKGGQGNFNGNGAVTINGANNGQNGGPVSLTGGTSGASNGGPATLAGGSGNGTGGIVTIVGGVGGNSGGGSITMTGGAATANSGGGSVSISGGASNGGNGASVSLTATAGVGTNKNGGNIILTAAAATGSGTAGAIELLGGNVGVKNATPVSSLDVNGTLSLNDGTTKVNSIIPNISVNGTARTLRFNNSTTTATEGFQFFNSNTSTSLMMIEQNGNVGIGNTNPGFPLQVTGNGTPFVVNGTGTVIGEIQSTTGTGGIAQLMLGTSTSVGATNVGGSVSAQRTDASVAGDSDLIFKNSAGTTMNTNMIIKSTGLVGIGTASPTNILSISGSAAQTIWMERNLTANTAGNSLTLQSSGATVGATDKGGGQLILSAGTSTGTGAGTSSIAFKTATPSGSGTTDNVPSTKMFISSAGLVGIGNISPTYMLDVVGDSIGIGTAGSGYRTKEGSNAKQGIATLAAGTAVVSNTSVTANSRIFLTIQSLGTVAVPSAIGVTARSVGASFTITSTAITDTSVIAYEIFEPY